MGYLLGNDQRRERRCEHAAAIDGLSTRSHAETTVETDSFAVPLEPVPTIQNAGTQAATYAIVATCGAMPGCGAKQDDNHADGGCDGRDQCEFHHAKYREREQCAELVATYTNAASQAIANTGSRPTVTPALRPSVSPRGRGRGDVGWFWARQHFT